jgi:hypothetical protein
MLGILRKYIVLDFEPLPFLYFFLCYQGMRGSVEAGTISVLLMDSANSDGRCLALKLSSLCGLTRFLNKHQENFCSANQVLYFLASSALFS